MKNIINKVIAFAVLMALVSSCEDNDDNTNESIVNYTRATVTLSSNSNTVFDESAIDADDESTYVITITATLPSSQPIDAVIDLVQSGGTASSSDFSAGTITIPAGSLSKSANVEIFQTGDIEGNETLNLTGKSRANFNIVPYTFNASIENDYINNVLELSTNWSGEYSFDGITLDFCEIDIDVLLFTSAGGFVGYLGATGACTEAGEIIDLDDGDYYIVLQLYDNPYSGFEETETVPITVTYSQDYFMTGSFTYTGINLSSPLDLYAAAVLTVSGGYNYTVTTL